MTELTMSYHSIGFPLLRSIICVKKLELNSVGWTKRISYEHGSSVVDNAEANRLIRDGPSSTVSAQHLMSNCFLSRLS